MIGDRIKYARKGAGLSLRGLAEIVKVSHSAIQKYEKGFDVPSSPVLIALAKALNVSIDYFFRESVVSLSSANFRKRSRLGKKKQATILAKALEFLERYVQVEELSPYDRINFKKPRCFSQKLESLEDVEDAAISLRNSWQLGMGPISSLVEEIEEKGVKIVITSIEDEQFDGCSAFVNNNTPVVCIAREWPGDRQRFTIAHELGHLMIGDYAQHLNGENIANRFAGAFLLPRDTVMKELGRHRHSFLIRELIDLKLKYGVSIQCWIRRAFDVGIISKSFYTSIMIDFGKRGWRKKEPGELVNREKPKRMERKVYRALRENMVSEAKAAELLNISISTLRELIHPSREGDNLGYVGG
ncbi:MAG: ImmA/IrrE family metallo-endopeptidase [FCB group bacterium]|nr:ImmA/IrrE family metallo-endopeptidase [FCB group bacterium]